jgi:5-methyltetrahydropteroyltriglutamate--homocysteine methyltransferase
VVTENKAAVKYRADHVGSLLRPPELLKAREEQAAGRLSIEELRKLEDRCILDAIEMQRQSGISVLSDGEYRRWGWSEAWNRVMAPFRMPVPESAPPPPVPTPIGRWKGPGADLIQQGQSNPAQRQAVPQNQAIGRRIDLDQTERMTAHESAFLKQHAGGMPFKITMPGVGQFAPTAYRAGLTDKVYASREELVMDVAAVMHREIEALVDEGVPYIQLDSLRYVMQIADPERRQAMIDGGQNPDEELDLTIRADNAALDGIDRKGSVIGLHMCRGNNRSSWAAEGPYDSVAEKTFSQLKVDRLLLEYDDERRSGGFEVLRYVPKDRVVVLGIVSSKLAELETVDSLRRRIEEAAKYFPLENLAISPQCGFASMAPGNLLTMDEQKRKLELVAETSRKVWG